MVTGTTSYASERPWSIVPYIGISQIDDQSASFSNATNIADGSADVSLDTGFTAGLSVRYDYTDSRWTSEFGWEYRSNDATTTAADGAVLPGGNYASNIFYLNGRYSLNSINRLTPWLGAGLTMVQEVDLDSEDASGERSFSDSGATGFQVMAGVDYTLSDRYYLTTEMRYSSISDLALQEESGSGQVDGLDYQPATIAIGLGWRF